MMAYTPQPQYAHPIVLEPEVAPVEMPIVEESPCLDDKEKTFAVPEQQSKTTVSHSSPKEALPSPKAADENVDSVLHSIHALFIFWEQVKVSSALRYSSTTRPSTSSISTTKDMNALEKVVLAYTSFMDKYISTVSATNQRELLTRLSEVLASALKHPILKLLTDIRLTLREIY
ncbi:Uncharacterized protein Adt_23225 [Abeliophyllum distichum]|uniref:Uncharacterized protein n=1 Tax=Abeliophyllum distichum TaxID=126358 RepID=A0ABD1SAG9_9LAMI